MSPAGKFSVLENGGAWKTVDHSKARYWSRAGVNNLRL